MRSTTLAAGLLGFSGVALGAFGAHWLKPALIERGMVDVWDKAVFYHLVHAVAVWGALRSAGPVAPRVNATAWCWTAGVVLFSGSLYALALGGPRWLGPITPLGGVALLAGWGVVVYGALRKGDK